MGAKIFIKKVHVYDRVCLTDDICSIYLDDDLESNGLPGVAFQETARHGVLPSKTRRGGSSVTKDVRKIHPSRRKS